MKYPRFEAMNRRILDLDDAHPAKKFLRAFIECREDCVGRELGSGGQVPIEQTWLSAVDGKRWTFSDFAYAFLSRELALDEIVTGTPFEPGLRSRLPKELPPVRQMLTECAQAARENGNDEIVELTDQVQRMFDLWEEYARISRLPRSSDMIRHANCLRRWRGCRDTSKNPPPPVESGARIKETEKGTQEAHHVS